MNIGIDIRSLMTEKISGVGNYVYYAVKNILLLDKTNNYYLFTSGLKKYKLPKSFQQDNVTHLHARVPNKFLNLRLLLKIGKPLDKYFDKELDLFWMPNLHFYKFSAKAKVIFTVHDLSYLHSKNFYSLRMKIWHKLARTYWMISHCYKVISVSDNTKRDIMRWFTIPPDKVKIIYPGVNKVKMDKERASALTREFKLPAKYFIFLGTLEPRKNIMSIIQAFGRYHKEYPEMNLVLVGGLGWVYRKLLKQIRKKSYIKYLGFVKSPKKDALYFLSQGLIWPSFYEGFGFPPLEATYYYKPVIISYKTSLPEIMKQQALYIDPYNSTEIYYLLKTLTKDKKLRQGIEESAKKFPIPDWSIQANEIINLFKQCA